MTPTTTRTAADVLALEGVRALLEDAADRAAPFLAVAEEAGGPIGWHFYVLTVEDASLALAYTLDDWTAWRPASAGHRLIDRGYMVSPPAHFEDDRVAGWAPLPGGRWSAPLHLLEDVVGKPTAEDQEETETTATLWVDSYSSTCGRCGQGAYTADTHHHRIAPGFDLSLTDTPGCGARFTEIATRRLEFGPEKLQALRPDLPIRQTHRK